MFCCVSFSLFRFVFSARPRPADVHRPSTPRPAVLPRPSSLAHAPPRRIRDYSFENFALANSRDFSVREFRAREFSERKITERLCSQFFPQFFRLRSVLQSSVLSSSVYVPSRPVGHCCPQCVRLRSAPSVCDRPVLNVLQSSVRPSTFRHVPSVIAFASVAYVCSHVVVGHAF